MLNQSQTTTQHLALPTGPVVDHDEALAAHRAIITGDVAARTRYQLGITSVLVCLALSLGLATPVPNIVRAAGEVAPAHKPVRVDAAYSGRLAELLVEDGQIVTAGTPLARLEDDQLRLRLVGLADTRSLLSAQLTQERALLFAEAGINDRPASIDDRFLHKAHLLPLEIRSSDLEIETLVNRVNSLKAEQEVLARFVDQIPAEQEAIDEELAIERQLSIRGIASRLREIEATRAALENRRDLAEFVRDMRRLEGEAVNAGHEINVTKRERAAERYERIAVLEEKIQQVDIELSALRQQSQHLWLMAPVDGVVSLKPTPQLGAVLRAGEPIISLLEAPEQTEAFLRLPIKDRAKVEIGDPVHVRIRGVSPKEHDGIKGEISSISIEPRTEENNDEAFFRAIVTFDRPAATTSGDITPMAGLHVDAVIVTGEERVYEIMLDPVLRALDGYALTGAAETPR